LSGERENGYTINKFSISAELKTPKDTFEVFPMVKSQSCGVCLLLSSA
jgi:hypothetical protein